MAELISGSTSILIQCCVTANFQLLSISTHPIDACCLTHCDQPVAVAGSTRRIHTVTTYTSHCSSEFVRCAQVLLRSQRRLPPRRDARRRPARYVPRASGRLRVGAVWMALFGLDVAAGHRPRASSCSSPFELFALHDDRWVRTLVGIIMASNSVVVNALRASVDDVLPSCPRGAQHGRRVVLWSLRRPGAEARRRAVVGGVGIPTFAAARWSLRSRMALWARRETPVAARGDGVALGSQRPSPCAGVGGVGVGHGGRVASCSTLATVCPACADGGRRCDGLSCPGACVHRRRKLRAPYRRANGRCACGVCDRSAVWSC